MLQDSLDIPKAQKFMNGGYSAMKQRTKFSKRFLAVLLAMLMLLAAAQPVSFVAAAAGDDPDPSFGNSAARARYTTSGTLEISFPEAQSTAGGIAYYADFYDLDQAYPQRETPVQAAVKLTGARTIEGESAQVFAEISADQIKTYGLNMSHRISVAITAIDADGWRSQPIEVLVGESLDVPALDSSPTGSDLYTSLSRFEDAYDSTMENGGTHSKGAKYWDYNNGNGTAAMNIDGVFDGIPQAYQTPGFDSSQAFRLYLNGNERSEDTYERFDVMYNQDHYQFTNAEELWIWVDTSYVEFKEFALQLRYMDYSGTARYDRDGKSGKADTTTHQYSADAYSTVGYAARKKVAGEDSRVPVYYQNADDLWDTMYTNQDGYLENFGHYRGFLRVNLHNLLNENQESPYADVWTERPYTFNVEIGWADWYKAQNDYTWPDEFEFTGAYQNNVPAEELLKNPSGFTWRWNGSAVGPNRWKYVTFNAEDFKAATGLNLTTTPINDIASVGFTWRGASEDSMNKPFYIDQIGFSGENLITDSKEGNPVRTLDQCGMVPSDQEAVNALVDKYIPDVEAVNVTDAGIIEDLEAICEQLKATVTLPEKLKNARDRLNQILNGQDTVVYLHTELQKSDADIPALFELYQTFTLGQLQRLGLKDEAELIRRYNETGQSEWYPSALTQLSFKEFNTMEQNYTVGQTAIHEYDDYRLEPNGKWHYFDRAHKMLWENGVYKGAWENSKNLVAYSRSSYNAAESGTNNRDQRFGLAATFVGQNGFANSRSIDTSFYRDSLSDSETYRISLTYNGENKDNWDELGGVNIGQATDFIFYADFSEMTDIRKMWVTLRTENGNVYSHDEDDTAPWDYQILDMDAAAPEWKTVQTDSGNDGCLTGEALNGFRGFIKIPLSHFYEITSSGNPGALISANSVVKQIKLFYTGYQGGVSPAGATMSLDMFGFSSNTQMDGFEPFRPERELEEPQFKTTDVDSITTAILDLYEDVTLLNETEAETDYLFSYGSTAESVTAYNEMLSLYHTLTVDEKKEVEQKLPSNIKMADMAAFVRNYDTFGGAEGNLKKYVDNAVAQCGHIESVFQTTAVSTGPVGALLEEYNDYSAKYQNAVLTYWADRNLNAVYPNFTITTPSTETAPVAELTLQGDQYTGGVPLSYYCAADAKHSIELEVPSTATLTAEDGTEETVLVSIANTTVFPTAPGTMQLTLSVKETEVPHAATYTGTFVVKVKTPAPDLQNAQDSNLDQVNDPAQYRMQTYTVHVRLVSDPSYTVVIPADTSIEWFTTSAVPVGEGVQVEDVKIPSSASIQVGVSAEKYAMEKNGNSIPYLLNNGKKALSHTFTLADQTPFQLEVLVNDLDSWLKVPYEEGYQDVLNFTINYQEAS